MGAPVNGTVVKKGYNWDNDPGLFVVDQLYQVRVEGNIDDLSAQFCSTISQIDNGIDDPEFNIIMEARLRFDNAEKVLRFTKKCDKLGLNYTIFEYINPIMSAGSFQTISLDNLKKIISGERKPKTKFVSSMNPRFWPAVDIGD